MSATTRVIVRYKVKAGRVLVRRSGPPIVSPEGLLDADEHLFFAPMPVHRNQESVVVPPQRDDVAVVVLGRLSTDSGRMETRQWAYFAPAVRRVHDAPSGDEELELSFVEPAELRRLAVSGELVNAIHLGIVGLAMLRGLF